MVPPFKNMTEQKTIQNGLALAQEWGPYLTLSVIFGIIIFTAIIAFILYAKNVKKHAVDPSIDNAKDIANNSKDIANNKKEIDELRKKYGDAKEEVNALKVELEKRVPFTWAEDKILPRMDSIDQSVSKLALVTEKYMTITEQHTKTGEQLTKAIDKLSDRILKVEKYEPR